MWWLTCIDQGAVDLVVHLFFLSIKELDVSQLKELQAALKGFVKKNETLKLETKVSTQEKQLYLSQGNKLLFASKF